jgi:hypothetical protein
LMMTEANYWECPINNVGFKIKTSLAKTYKIKVIQYSKYKPSCSMVFTHFQPIPWMPGKTTFYL